MIVDLVAVFIAALSLFVAVYAARLSKDNATLEMTQTLHENLLSDRNAYKLFYRISGDHLDYHFSEDDEGVEGNFIGSEDGEPVDLFLEKLNFICFLLLEGDVGAAGKLFDSYVKKTLTAKFTQEYLKFLSDASEQGDEVYYPFLRRYAVERLGLDLDRVVYRKGPRPAEAVSPAPASPSARDP